MTKKNVVTQEKISELLTIMVQLRDVDSGCPWDVEQSFETIAPYTIEEAYEVAEAIQKNDMPALCDELGDLLFQVVFHSRIAQEQGCFKFEDVVESICNKLLRRHPHVFNNEVVAKEDLAKQWEAHKRKEQKLDEEVSILGAVSAHQPAINQAYKLQKKASSVGFDWPNIEPVMEKLMEEITELSVEMKIKDNRKRMEEELGDVLFSCVNLARHLDINPEWSLRQANSRFSARFSYIEQTLKQQGRSVEASSLDELDALWDEAKESLMKKN